MRYDAVVFLESLFRPVDLSPADLTPDWYVVWEERVAFMQFEGGMPRELAEHHALLEVQKQMGGPRPVPRSQADSSPDVQAPPN